MVIGKIKKWINEKNTTKQLKKDAKATLPALNKSYHELKKSLVEESRQVRDIATTETLRLAELALQEAEEKLAIVKKRVEHQSKQLDAMLEKKRTTKPTQKTTKKKIAKKKSPFKKSKKKTTKKSSKK